MLKSEIVSSLRQILAKDAVLSRKEELFSYSYDGTDAWSHMPDLVVFPETTKQISEIMKIASANLIPVTARGGGTNLSGGSIPINGGIVLCTTRMDKILDINKYNLTTVVQPGLILQDLNNALAADGLFYPPDPQSFLGCTIGGTVAENAGGPYCLKYGVTKQYVLGLEVVLADGRIMSVGAQTVKNRMGYELAMLFTGSEGTLGIITRVTLRLMPRPKATKTLIAVFEDMVKGGQSVSNILADGVIPAKIEIVDNFVIRGIEQATPIGLPVDARAMLMIQVDGSSETVEADSKRVSECLKKAGAMFLRVSGDASEETSMWKMRSAGAGFFGGKTVIGEDVTVPRDKLPVFIQKLADISAETGFPIPFVGHAGDGNLHPTLAFNMKDEDETARARAALQKIVDAALSVGGVLSGEHGIGLEKRRFFNKAIDPVALDVMKSLKKVLDPDNILNPGKIWE
jgi:glycolate oxidase